MNNLKLAFIAVPAIAALGLGACNTLPKRVDSLEQARAAVAAVNRDPIAAQAAGENLREAEAALKAADQAYLDRQKLPVIEHQAYVAQRHADIAQEQIAEARVQEKIKQSEMARADARLNARTQEADSAKQEADSAKQEAAAQKQSAEMAQSEADRLKEELENLQAKQTERGMVLTLGDVLFATGAATLNPGATATLDNLAAFMKEFPDRRLIVEGHTDNRGSEEFNAQLSGRRAESVRNALMVRGVLGERISAVGAGESFPVSGNDNSAGMQLNRRVEIVISDESGNFPAGATRVSSIQRPM